MIGASAHGLFGDLLSMAHPVSRRANLTGVSVVSRYAGGGHWHVLRTRLAYREPSQVLPRMSRSTPAQSRQPFPSWSVIEAGLRDASYYNPTIVHDITGIARKISDVESDVSVIDLGNPNRDMLENMFQLSRIGKRADRDVCRLRGRP